MPKPILTLIVFLISLSTYGQKERPYFMEYSGESRVVTKQKLGQYLLFYGYNGQFSDTDSTVDITITQPGADWAISSSFYFGTGDSCRWISHTRCDKYQEAGFANVLANKKAGWVKLNETTYVTKYAIGELMDVTRKDSCLTYRTRWLKMTKTEYKNLLRRP
jgi:hypothetical protein